MLSDSIFETCWFGKSWYADICLSQPHVETPVGTHCNWCMEKIKMGDQGVVDMSGRPSHRNCFLRQIIGAVDHLKGKCSHYVLGSTCTDPVGMTRREAADAAVKLYYEKYEK